jgi:flagellar M-ring protein FliF
MVKELKLNNYISLLSKDIKRLWSGLDFPQRLAIILLVIITIIAISFFITKSTEPNWGVLYSDLSEPDAVSVVENLKKAGYAYKLSDDKKTVLVPADQKEELRLMIAENDIIHDSNPGFELLDKVQLGATDFQNKLTRQRIFQGELTRTIEKIQGIKKARVQIADPERSVFSDSDESPTASVMLILDPGVKIKQEQVKAIKNLVAYGIPRLTAEKVFITDQNGSPLSDEAGGGGSSDITDFRTGFETEISKKVQGVLEKLVGTDNVNVQVSATMNFDSARATIEKYTPAAEGGTTPEGIAASSQIESENYGNGAPSTANVPAGGKNMNYQKTKTTKNFNVSKEIKQVVYAPGTVEKLTIAVALNKILTTKEKDEIRNLVVSASGANIERGDVITITGMQFADDGTSHTQMIKEMEKSSQTEFWVRTLAPALTVLVLGLAALFVFNSLLKKPFEGQEVYSGHQDHYDDGEEEPELLEAASFPAIEAKLEPELERMKTDINNLILSDPAEAARLLLSYVKE